jgi:hypothetical protein
MYHVSFLDLRFLLRCQLPEQLPEVRPQLAVEFFLRHFEMKTT